MTARQHRPAPPGGAYELVDNFAYGNHQQALKWLANNYVDPLNVATGYVSLKGLDTLTGIGQAQEHPVRLLIGVEPQNLAGSGQETVAGRFEQSVSALRRERDFSAFPAARRAVLERVTGFLESDQVEVRRYARRFLHGKAYIFGDFDGRTCGTGAALVSSANLTQGGLVANLELGMVHYQCEVVRKALEWYQGLWEDAEDYRERLLELLRPPSLERDPGTVYLRALLELYGNDLDPDGADLPESHSLTAFQRDGYARARRILNEHGGVLYADGVGMGKTEIGIEFIREYARERGQHVLVISPAQLRDRLWQQRLSEENLPGDVVSYQELAQDRQLSSRGDSRVLRVNKDVYRLVIIDEAHAYRNVDNTWYAALDRLMGGESKKLLLLTATPVNNSLWDLHNLFLLFGRHDGAFSGEPLRIPSLRKFFADAGASGSESPSEARLFPLIDALTVRRDRAFIKQHYSHERFSDGTLVKFPEPKLCQRRYDLDNAHPGVVQAVYDGIDGLTMARYRLSAYRVDGQEESASEEALAGLMQSQFLKRFESSWYAALQTVNRMRDGNDAILRVIAERGVVPPAEVIRDLVGDADEDDSFLSADLIDEALAASGDGIPADRFNDRFLADLENDRDALAAMSLQLRNLEGRPDPKLEAVREVMSTTRARKVAVFTAFQDTAAYLKERIESQPDVLGGRAWTVVIGSRTSAEDRAEELARFCPESVTGDPAFAPKKARWTSSSARTSSPRDRTCSRPRPCCLSICRGTPSAWCSAMAASSACAAPTTRPTSTPCCPSGATWTACWNWKPNSRPRSWRPTPRWAWKPRCWTRWQPNPRCTPTRTSLWNVFPAATRPCWTSGKATGRTARRLPVNSSAPIFVGLTRKARRPGSRTCPGELGRLSYRSLRRWQSLRCSLPAEPAGMNATGAWCPNRERFCTGKTCRCSGSYTRSNSPAFPSPEVSTWSVCSRWPPPTSAGSVKRCSTLERAPLPSRPASVGRWMCFALRTRLRAGSTTRETGPCRWAGTTW